MLLRALISYILALVSCIFALVFHFFIFLPLLLNLVTPCRPCQWTPVRRVGLIPSDFLLGVEQIDDFLVMGEISVDAVSVSEQITRKSSPYRGSLVSKCLVGEPSLTFSSLTGWDSIHLRIMSCTALTGASVLMDPGRACERETAYPALTRPDL